jgi:hypothetical protein
MQIECILDIIDKNKILDISANNKLKIKEIVINYETDILFAIGFDLEHNLPYNLIKSLWGDLSNKIIEFINNNKNNKNINSSESQKTNNTLTADKINIFNINLDLDDTDKNLKKSQEKQEDINKENKENKNIIQKDINIVVNKNKILKENKNNSNNNKKKLSDKEKEKEKLNKSI